MTQEELIASGRLVARGPVWELREFEPGLLLIVPEEGAADSVESAQALVEAIAGYGRSQGRTAGVVGFVDRMGEQALPARRLYARLGRPELVASAALLGATGFGRAVASVFLGLYRPSVPIALFEQPEEALDWLRASVAEHARPTGGGR